MHIFKEAKPACRHKEVRQVEDLAWGAIDGIGPISEKRPVRFRVLRGMASTARFKRQLQVYAQEYEEHGAQIDPAYVVDALKDLCHHLHREPVPTGARGERLRIVGTVTVDAAPSPHVYRYSRTQCARLSTRPVALCKTLTTRRVCGRTAARARFTITEELMNGIACRPLSPLPSIE